MKKNALRLLSLSMAACVAFGTVSCSKDTDTDTEVVAPGGIAANSDSFKGVVKNGETVKLDPAKVYKMTGSVVVEEGGTLIIPAGTRIEASGGTESYLTVKQGGKIFAEGTSAKPIVFTSTNPTPGSWGGIVICGRAPINKGLTATAEVGNGTYGGNDVNDNSGVLRFVKIEYAGAIFTAEKEFNGLSLFGVGKGTVIDNIAIVNGSDDGIEFFGGTVNVSNIVSVGNEDDAFDWTEGWTGKATNLYAKRRADGSGNRGVEGDNNSTNNAATPVSSPTLENVTLIGATNGESDGMKLREGTQANINNVVLSGWKTGINIQHDGSVGYFNGKGKITNVKYINVQNKLVGKLSSGADVILDVNTVNENAAATGAGNAENMPNWANWAGL